MTLQELHMKIVGLLGRGVPGDTPVHLQLDINELGNGQEARVVEYITAHSYYPGGPLHTLVYPDQQPQDDEIFLKVISITT